MIQNRRSAKVGRLRKRELLPDDTAITAKLIDAKIVTGKYGRQMQATVRIVDGEYRGAQFKEWFSFRTDSDTNEEFISYGSALYNLLKIADPDIDDSLDDEELSDREYEKWLQSTVKSLDGAKIMARVAVHTPKNDASKKRNKLDPGSIGPYQDPEAGFADLALSGANEEHD
jgi:hypothetical protein